jgi:hypothetical protein
MHRRPQVTRILVISPSMTLAHDRHVPRAAFTAATEGSGLDLDGFRLEHLLSRGVQPERTKEA